MPVMLMRLRGVPDDEAQEIRELLDRNQIEYYETPAGNWGISMPSLWMHDESQLPKAKVLLEQYQEQRAAKARKEYAALKQEGKAPMLLHALRERPLQFIFSLVFIIFILYVSTVPFIEFGS